MAYVPGYSVTIRRDRRTGELLAFIPRAYRDRHGERYYLAITLTNGWVELTPDYATSCTRTVTDYPESFKRFVDRDMGYRMHVAPRLYG